MYTALAPIIPSQENRHKKRRQSSTRTDHSVITQNLIDMSEECTCIRTAAAQVALHTFDHWPRRKISVCLNKLRDFTAPSVYCTQFHLAEHERMRTQVAAVEIWRGHLHHWYQRARARAHGTRFNQQSLDFLRIADVSFPLCMTLEALQCAIQQSYSLSTADHLAYIHHFGWISQF